MKKALIILLLITAPIAAVFAETAEYFTFTMATGGGYDMTGSSVSAGVIFGIDYNFDSQFTSGFKFFKLGPGEVAVVNVTIHPQEEIAVSLYSGADDAAPANIVFGVGVGFDFFSKKDGLFSSMGVFADWLAGSGGAYDVTSGGSLVIGLKTRFGL